MFKSNGGFTLVELIVVIAILAILAGIAVPSYTGYINKANDTACLSELKALATAAQASCAYVGDSLETITVSTTGQISVTPAAAEGYTEFYTPASNLGELITKHSKGASGASWTVADGWNLIEGD